MTSTTTLFPCAALAMAAMLLLGSCAGLCPNDPATTTPNTTTEKKLEVPVNPNCVEALAWMSGEWVGPAGDDGTICEMYNHVEGGLMQGTSRVVQGGKSVHTEYLEVLTSKDGKVVYRAFPRGQLHHDFPLTSHSNQVAVFEDPKHDFPAWIQYTRVGDTLTVDIRGGGAKASQTMQFVMQLRK